MSEVTQLLWQHVDAAIKRPGDSSAFVEAHGMEPQDYVAAHPMVMDEGKELHLQLDMMFLSGSQRYQRTKAGWKKLLESCGFGSVRFRPRQDSQCWNMPPELCSRLARAKMARQQLKHSRNVIDCKKAAFCDGSKISQEKGFYFYLRGPHAFVEGLACMIRALISESSATQKLVYDASCRITESITMLRIIQEQLAVLLTQVYLGVGRQVLCAASTSVYDATRKKLRFTSCAEAIKDFYQEHVEEVLLSIRDDLVKTFQKHLQGSAEVGDVRLTAESLSRHFLSKQVVVLFLAMEQSANDGDNDEQIRGVDTSTLKSCCWRTCEG
ncbi:hypothetical protein SELMODRAFT_410060 [Selaginella moellendorffii]|uniref:Uncharacterized protein n=1 Tax=Selaginella moellendorffii TaxID=88036 RepID=D8RDC4_SELML|nr:hypothetical protein SELMODRAFT_410060 [Selaginella moellendorffii]